MAPAPKYNPNALYFSKKLKDNFSAISNFPLTVIEAPIGYGKTTAMRWALRKTDAKILWQNTYSYGISSFWPSFCDSLSRFDGELADTLRQIGFPCDSVLIQKTVELIRNAKPTSETMIIIDDYHFIGSPIIDSFFPLLLLAGLPQKLHIVLISRAAFLNDGLAELRLKGFVHYIGADAFILEPEDIGSYYALCGISITQDEQTRLFNYSEGWIAPLYLSMLEFIAQGSFTASGDVNALVHNMVYRPLSKEMKAFLNCICMFNSFSAKQAHYMWQQDNSDTLLRELLLKNTLITQDYRRAGHYSFHNVFLAYVRKMFHSQLTDAKKKLWERAGCWHLNNKEFPQAIDFFEQADHYSLLLAALAGENGVGITGERKQKIIQYFDHCPEEIKAKNLSAMLVFIRFMIYNNEFDRLKKACTTFEQNIGFWRGTEDEKYALLENYELLLALMKFNNIGESAKHLQAAFAYGDKLPSGANKKWHLVLGSPSMLLHYYRESGKLAEHLQALKESIPLYYRLTNGDNCGTEYNLEAEIAFNQGDFEKAESVVHKGFHYAREKNQYGGMLSASFLQARLAFIKGNYSAVIHIKEKMFDLLESKKQYLYLQTLDVCVSCFYLLLNRPEQVTDWIASGDFTNTRLTFQALPALHIVYGRYLLLNGEYLKLIGMADVFLQVARVHSNLLAQVYTYIYLAAVYSKLSRHNEAALNLEKAFEIALPDKIYMPFAVNGGYIADLLKKYRAARQYSNDIEQILNLYAIQAHSTKKIIRACLSNQKTGLTIRENEVAVLAAEGLSNKKIAERLFMSENTVKARLKAVFEKLSIQSRVQLQEWKKTQPAFGNTPNELGCVKKL